MLRTRHRSYEISTDDNEMAPAGILILYKGAWLRPADWRQDTAKPVRNATTARPLGRINRKGAQPWQWTKTRPAL